MALGRQFGEGNMIRIVLFVLILKPQTCQAEKDVANNQNFEQRSSTEFMQSDIANSEKDNSISDKVFNFMKEWLDLNVEYKKSQANSLSENTLKNDNKKVGPRVLPWLIPELSDNYVSHTESKVKTIPNSPWNRKLVDKSGDKNLDPSFPWFRFHDNSKGNVNKIVQSAEFLLIKDLVDYIENNNNSPSSSSSSSKPHKTDVSDRYSKENNYKDYFMNKNNEAPAIPWLVKRFLDISKKNDKEIKKDLPWFRYDNSITSAPRPWNKEDLEEFIYGDNNKLDILLKKMSRSSEQNENINEAELQWLKDTIESYEDREKPRLYFGSAIMPWNKQEADSPENMSKALPWKNENVLIESLWKRLDSLGLKRNYEKDEKKESHGFLNNDKSSMQKKEDKVVANFQTKEDTMLESLKKDIEKESSNINNEIANYELFEKINEFLSPENSSETD